MSCAGKRSQNTLVLHRIADFQKENQIPNSNGINGKDLHSDSGVSVRLLGFPCVDIADSLCNSFNDSYRIFMLDQCLLKPPRVFLLVVSKGQALSDWH